MDPSAEDPDPPSGSKPEEPETSPMAAVPAGPDVVWPEDPFEADGHAAEVEPDTAAPADPPWTQQAFGRPTVRPPHLAHQHTAPADDDPHTAPFPTAAAASSWSEKSPSEPSVGKTQPPPSSVMGDAMKTQPPTPRATNEIVEAGDEVKTAPPAPAASAQAAASETDETEDTRPPVPRSRGAPACRRAGTEGRRRAPREPATRIPLRAGSARGRHRMRDRRKASAGGRGRGGIHPAGRSPSRRSRAGASRRDAAGRLPRARARSEAPPDRCRFP